MNFPFSCSVFQRGMQYTDQNHASTCLRTTGVVEAMIDINVLWDATACILLHFFDFSMETAASVFRVPALKT